MLKSSSSRVVNSEKGSRVLSPRRGSIVVVSPGRAATRTVSPGRAATRTVSPGRAGTRTVSPGRGTATLPREVVAVVDRPPKTRRSAVSRIVGRSERADDSELTLFNLRCVKHIITNFKMENLRSIAQPMSVKAWFEGTGRSTGHGGKVTIRTGTSDRDVSVEKQYAANSNTCGPVYYNTNIDYATAMKIERPVHPQTDDAHAIVSNGQLFSSKFFDPVFMECIKNRKIRYYFITMLQRYGGPADTVKDIFTSTCSSVGSMPIPVGTTVLHSGMLFEDIDGAGWWCVGFGDTSTEHTRYKDKSFARTTIRQKFVEGTQYNRLSAVNEPDNGIILRIFQAKKSIMNASKDDGIVRNPFWANYFIVHACSYFTLDMAANLGEFYNKSWQIDIVNNTPTGSVCTNLKTTWKTVVPYTLLGSTARKFEDIYSDAGINCTQFCSIVIGGTDEGKGGGVNCVCGGRLVCGASVIPNCCITPVKQIMEFSSTSDTIKTLDEWKKAVQQSTFYLLKLNALGRPEIETHTSKLSKDLEAEIKTTELKRYYQTISNRLTRLRNLMDSVKGYNSKDRKYYIYLAMQHLEEIKENVIDFSNKLYTGLFDSKSLEAVILESKSSLASEYIETEKILEDIKKYYNYHENPYAVESAYASDTKTKTKREKERDARVERARTARAERARASGVGAVVGDDEEEDDYRGLR